MRRRAESNRNEKVRRRKREKREMWWWWWWSQRKDNENPPHFINTVKTKGYDVIGVNDILAQERPSRCALYYSCARDFQVANGNSPLCINKPFFLG